ncbi:MAG: T9SS type A sorting domain-containing protein [Bacteroidota bacterium]
MAKFITTLLFIIAINNFSNAQLFRFYHTEQTPRFIKPGTLSDTLLNPFAGGLNTPQFSNIDWNGDGRQDLFIFDKESNKVFTYVFENGAFRYAPRYEAAFPFYMSGWALLRDYNFDGKPDLFTSSFSHNTVTAKPFVSTSVAMQLFVNHTENAKPLFKQLNNVVNDTGIYVGFPYNQAFPSSPVVSVGGALPSIEDIDGDNDLDILTNLGESPTNHFYENLKKNKWNIPYPDDSLAYILRDQCWGFASYNFNHYYELGLGRDGNINCAFNTWGKTTMKHADQSVLMIDLNGDGIKDAIMGDSENKSLIALINGRLQNSIKADSIISQDTLFLSTDNKRKGFMEYPASYLIDINGDDKKELVISTNKYNSSKTANNIWTYNCERVNSMLEFTPNTGTGFLYDNMIDHGLRSAPTFTDIDGDGDQDLIVATSGVFERTGNNHDRLLFYRNITDSLYPVFKLADSNFINISGTQGYFFAHPTFGDLNGDGKPDLIVGEGNGNLSYFINNSNGNAFSFTPVSRNAFNILAGTYATPQLVDLDKDGLLDLVIGNTAGTIRYYKNKGSKTAPDFSSTATIDSLGKISTIEIFTTIGRSPMPDINGYSAPHVTDLDRNGTWELITGTSTGRILIYTDILPYKDSIAVLVDKPFVDYGTPGNDGYNKRFGNRTTIATAFLDGDDTPDIVAGNLAGGLVFLGSRASLNGITDKALLNDETVHIYPNPASSLLNITLPAQNYNTIQYTLFDVTGKAIRSGGGTRAAGSFQVNVSAIPEGMYFLRILANDQQLTKRIIINR